MAASQLAPGYAAAAWEVHALGPVFLQQSGGAQALQGALCKVQVACSTCPPIAANLRARQELLHDLLQLCTTLHSLCFNRITRQPAIMQHAHLLLQTLQCIHQLLAASASGTEGTQHLWEATPPHTGRCSSKHVGSLVAVLQAAISTCVHTPERRQHGQQQQQQHRQLQLVQPPSQQVLHFNIEGPAVRSSMHKPDCSVACLTGSSSWASTNGVTAGQRPHVDSVWHDVVRELAHVLCCLKPGLPELDNSIQDVARALQQLCDASSAPGINRSPQLHACGLQGLAHISTQPQWLPTLSAHVTTGWCEAHATQHLNTIKAWMLQQQEQPQQACDGAPDAHALQLASLAMGGLTHALVLLAELLHACPRSTVYQLAPIGQLLHSCFRLPAQLSAANGFTSGSQACSLASGLVLPLLSSSTALAKSSATAAVLLGSHRGWASVPAGAGPAVTPAPACHTPPFLSGASPAAHNRHPPMQPTSNHDAASKIGRPDSSSNSSSYSRGLQLDSSFHPTGMPAGGGNMQAPQPYVRNTGSSLDCSLAGMVPYLLHVVLHCVGAAVEVQVQQGHQVLPRAPHNLDAWGPAVCSLPDHDQQQAGSLAVQALSHMAHISRCQQLLLGRPLQACCLAGIVAALVDHPQNAHQLLAPVCVLIKALADACPVDLQPALQQCGAVGLLLRALTSDSIAARTAAATALHAVVRRSDACMQRVLDAGLAPLLLQLAQSLAAQGTAASMPDTGTAAEPHTPSMQQPVGVTITGGTQRTRRYCTPAAACMSTPVMSCQPHPSPLSALTKQVAHSQQAATDDALPISPLRAVAVGSTAAAGAAAVPAAGPAAPDNMALVRALHSLMQLLRCHVTRHAGPQVGLLLPLQLTPPPSTQPAVTSEPAGVDDSHSSRNTSSSGYLTAQIADRQQAAAMEALIAGPVQSSQANTATLGAGCMAAPGPLQDACSWANGCSTETCQATGVATAQPASSHTQDRAAKSSAQLHGCRSAVSTGEGPKPTATQLLAQAAGRHLLRTQRGAAGVQQGPPHAHGTSTSGRQDEHEGTVAARLPDGGSRAPPVVHNAEVQNNNPQQVCRQQPDPQQQADSDWTVRAVHSAGTRTQSEASQLINASRLGPSHSYGQVALPSLPGPLWQSHLASPVTMHTLPDGLGIQFESEVVVDGERMWVRSLVKQHSQESAPSAALEPHSAAAHRTTYSFSDQVSPRSSPSPSVEQSGTALAARLTPRPGQAGTVGAACIVSRSMAGLHK